MAGFDRRDLIGGLMLIVGGAVPLVETATYPMGTLKRLGPGFFPTVLCVMLIALGVVILVGAMVRAGPRPTVDWLSLCSVPSGLLVFALTVDSLGLVPAVLLLVAISTVADRPYRPRRTLALAVVLTVACVLVFQIGLGMKMPAVRWPF